MKFLARSDCIAMDGTFKITPHPWSQVAIISVEISEECWIPVAYGLLPDKKRDTYDTFFILCPEPDFSKSYTQSHNLKDHRRKKHKDID